MKLDRNEKGRGKYAIINLRKLEAFRGTMAATGERPREAELVLDAVKILEARGLIEYGEPGTEHEFFVLMLKDKHSRAALQSYASSVEAHANRTDHAAHQYASDVEELAGRAGIKSQWCKDPD